MYVLLIHKIPAFIRLPKTDKKLFFRALWGLTHHALRLYCTPRNKLPTTWMSLARQHHNASQPNICKPNQILRAVNRAGKVLPFFSTCLTKSLTAAQLFQRYQLHCKVIFGLAKNPDQKLMAHAWLETDQQPAVVYQRKQAFRPIWTLNY